MQFHITPQTKVMELIEKYPEIEDYLISIVPTFEKLKNPLLRKTIGKLATMEQAASVGEVTLPFLINALNEKLGLLSAEISTNDTDLSSEMILDDNKRISLLNADEIIKEGGKPVSVVLSGLNKLIDDQILQLNCSFHPAPLIDKAKEAGYVTKEVRNKDFSHSIYFKRKIN